MIVVVLGVGDEDLGQMPLVGDQHVVEHFAAERSDNPFGIAIGPWGPRRSLNDLHALVGEDTVERAGELAVTVADEEAEGADPVRDEGCGPAGRSTRRPGWRSPRGRCACREPRPSHATRRFLLIRPPTRAVFGCGTA